MAKKQKKLTAMQVRWRPGSRFTESQVPAAKAQAELEKIRDQKGGDVTAVDVLEYAEGHSRSAMHKLIGMDGSWDDAAAARNFRLMRAGTIIRSLEVKYEEKPEASARAWQIDKTRWDAKETARKPFRSTEDILADDEARASLLQSALNELIAFQRKYRALNELAIVVRGIDEFMDSYHAQKSSK